MRDSPGQVSFRVLIVSLFMLRTIHYPPRSARTFFQESSGRFFFAISGTIPPGPMILISVFAEPF